MPSMPWFRYYSETADDNKFAFLARELGIPRYAVIGIWSILECRANQSPIRGYLYVTSEKRYSNGDIAAELNIEPELCNTILKAFTDMEMLEIDDGAYHLKNWEKRQYSSDSSADRVRKYREKQQCNVSVTADVTESSVSSSVSESESLIKESKESFSLPDSLNIPAFSEAWNEWIVYRKEIKHKITSTTASKQLKMLSGYDPPIAAAMLIQSIQNGWQGIFELKQNGNNGRGSTKLQRSLRNIKELMEEEDGKQE